MFILDTGLQTRFADKVYFGQGSHLMQKDINVIFFPPGALVKRIIY